MKRMTMFDNPKKNLPDDEDFEQTRLEVEDDRKTKN